MERKLLPRRPLGTDGSDFSYRMVVDSRYIKVAKGKTRLKSLIAIQTLSQVIVSTCMLLSAITEKELDKFAVILNSIGFMSILFGEFGRRKSRGSMLRVYIALSSIAASLSLVHFATSDLITKAIQDKNVSAMTTYDIFEAVHILMGVVLQIFVIITTLALVHNMSPPKKSS